MNRLKRSERNEERQMDLLTDFIQNIQENEFWKKEDRLLLAVSGGVDSMVMLELMTRLPKTIKPWLGVVHVNHQLREASDREEAAVKKICSEKNIPFYSTRWDKKDQPSSGTEVAARDFRYAFFQKTMQTQHAGYLLTAHHGEDQVETILMRLTRGGQIESFIGIKKKRSFGDGFLVRPLLPYEKEELKAYALSHDVVYFEDETNQTPEYTRNRYRQQLLPFLKAENAQAVTHFANFSADLSDTTAAAKRFILPLFHQLVQKDGMNKWFLKRSSYLKEEPFMRRLILKELFNSIYEGTRMEYQRQHLSAAASLIEGNLAHGEIHLPGNWIVRREYEGIQLLQQTKTKQEKTQEEVIELSLNHWYSISGVGKIGFFDTEHETEYRHTFPSKKQKRIWVNAKDIHLPLYLRKRNNGDRMTLKGKKKATKKLKDILIDQKVPLSERQKPIVLTDKDGEIIWLIDYKESRLSNKQETDTIQYVLVYEKE